MNKENKFDENDLLEIKTIFNSSDKHLLPRNSYFSKKVMKNILNQQSATDFGQRISIYIKVALFIGLCLFPALTEAI